VVGLISQPAGRAQTSQGARYAFSDTTLLRDTLGLRFLRLFPLSDSLQILPDTLRALSIRYQWSLERLCSSADSLGMPVDSVGRSCSASDSTRSPYSGRIPTAFVYNTSYDVDRTQSAWRNAVDFSMGRGAFYMNNTTSVQMDRYEVGNRHQSAANAHHGDRAGLEAVALVFVRRTSRTGPSRQP
jgi:hypothetical protein